MRLDTLWKCIFYLYLYRIGLRITLKGENPYLHSVNSKSPETILWLLSSITPGQTGTQFTAEWTKTFLLLRRILHHPRVGLERRLGALSSLMKRLPSSNWIRKGISTNDYRTRGRNSTGFTETVTHPNTNAGTCCLTSVIDENWCCQHATL